MIRMETVDYDKLNGCSYFVCSNIDRPENIMFSLESAVDLSPDYIDGFSDSGTLVSSIKRTRDGNYTDVF